jgi:hypothetical protein
MPPMEYRGKYNKDAVILWSVCHECRLISIFQVRMNMAFYHNFIPFTVVMSIFDTLSGRLD